MCGLVGVAGDLRFQDESVFKDLLYMDALRGFDSVGIGRIGLKNEVSVYKDTVPVMNFLNSNMITQMFRTVNRVLIGHNRFATQGAVNAVNAHPFKYGDITGVHNGTLIDTRDLPDWEKFEVDSENIIYSINKIGIEETHKNLMGAYALVWWDSSDETLNFVRNDERPFHYALSEDRTVIYWASEAGMLKAALDRRGVKTLGVVSTEIHKLYKFTFPLYNYGQDVDKTIYVTTKDLDPCWEYEQWGCYGYGNSWNQKPQKKYLPPAGCNRQEQFKQSVPKDDSLSVARSLLKRVGEDNFAQAVLTSYDGFYLSGTVFDDDDEVPLYIECKDRSRGWKLLEEEASLYVTKLLNVMKPKKGRNDEASVIASINDIFFAVDDDEDEDYEDSRDTISTLGGDVYTRGEFEREFKNTGCGCCGMPLDFDDDEMLIVNSEAAFCGECVETPFAQEYVEVYA